jgi:glycosyltransferase involved in cell wall biosynthesis
MPHDRLQVVRRIFSAQAKGASVRIAICSYSRGVGNGIAQMDDYLVRHMDRNVCSPLSIFIDTSTDGLFKRISPGRLHVSLDIALDRLPEIFRHVDIVQFNGSYDPVVCSAAEIAGKALVVEVMHNVEPGMMHQNVLCTVCVSRAVQTVQPDVGKTGLIRNGIDTRRFAPPQQRRRNPDKIVLMQPARRDKAMHISLDVLAPLIAAHWCQAEFWMVGPGQDAVPGCGSSAVKYLGVRADMERLYAEADFMVLLSREESFGLVAAEAMACGCLPIVSGDGGPAEFVEHGRDGYVIDCARPEDIIKGILQAMGARGDDEDLRHAARRKAVTMLDIGNTVREYEGLYSEMMSRSPARQPVTRRSRELAVLESRLMTLALLRRHGRSLRELVPLFAKIAASDQVLDPARLRHPNWGSVMDVVSSLAHELALHGNPGLARSFYGKLLSSRIVFPQYLQNWLASDPAPDERRKIRQALEAMGCR